MIYYDCNKTIATTTPPLLGPTDFSHKWRHSRHAPPTYQAMIENLAVFARIIEYLENTEADVAVPMSVISNWYSWVG